MTKRQINLSLTAEECAKLQALGGSRWVRQALAAEPEPAARALRTITDEERDRIAALEGRASRIAKTYGVPVHFVYRIRAERRAVQ